MKLNEMCELWAETRRRNAEVKAKEHFAALAKKKRDAEARAALADRPRLEKELVKLRSAHSLEQLWRSTSRRGTEREAAMARKVERRRTARARECELPEFGPSMVADRINPRWAATVRAEGLSGVDVMDFTLEDARSVVGLLDAHGLLAAVVRVRDELTRPVAELLRSLHDDDGTDDAANWSEAQALLTALFAQGLHDPTEARLAEAKDVERRFRASCSGGNAAVRSMCNALRDALE